MSCGMSANFMAVPSVKMQIESSKGREEVLEVN